MVLLVLVALLAPAEALGVTWSWPADGPLVRAFSYDARTPFAPGQRRGISLGAPRGSPVRAACAGRIRFAGTAGANGRVVTVLCGAYATTYLRLSSITVRSGATVRRGAPLGRAGPNDVGFGVRRRADRFAYVDPLALLPPRRGAPRAPVLGRAPRGRPPGRPPPVPVGSRPPIAGPSRTTAGHAALPLVAWLGLAAAALGVVGAPLVGVRRRRRSRAGATLRATWMRR